MGTVFGNASSGRLYAPPVLARAPQAAYHSAATMHRRRGKLKDGSNGGKVLRESYYWRGPSHAMLDDAGGDRIRFQAGQKWPDTRFEATLCRRRVAEV